MKVWQLLLVAPLVQFKVVIKAHFLAISTKKHDALELAELLADRDTWIEQGCGRRAGQVD